ncbi:cell shape determination protein CcmA [Clostridium sp. BJN0001]|uniref:cell shape determination protein CcmA n=1 Tax=Clostridium sp. BJN0001 TaxID=2930219 RepID=UPI001FD4DD67|nr:cell shape determination protein CcmA [Clostridium sp. BJN0001]
MEEKLIDMKISGSGKIGGGKYNEIKISGSAKIEGDIECSSYRCSGSSSASSNIKAETIKISGSTKIMKSLNTNELSISGSSHILGDVNAKKVKISGSYNVGGNLHTEDIKTSGMLSVGGDCEAENFNAQGGFNIGGLLNAGNIDVEIYGNCKAKDIGGENIKVKLGRSHLFARMLNIFMTNRKLEADTIEGDDVFLENTTARIVRGNNVIIGDNCNIDTVEYRNEININSNYKTVCKKID